MYEEPEIFFYIKVREWQEMKRETKSLEGLPKLNQRTWPSDNEFGRVLQGFVWDKGNSWLTAGIRCKYFRGTGARDDGCAGDLVLPLCQSLVPLPLLKDFFPSLSLLWTTWSQGATRTLCGEHIDCMERGSNLNRLIWLPQYYWSSWLWKVPSSAMSKKN